jgi:hypothetical protein
VETAFEDLSLHEQRLVAKACFEVVTKKWATEFVLKQGYAHFCATLGQENFWPQAEHPPTVCISGEIRINSSVCSPLISDVHYLMLGIHLDRKA